jgi:hypothetical protein
VNKLKDNLIVRGLAVAGTISVVVSVVGAGRKWA